MVYIIRMKCLFVANPNSGRGTIVKRKDYVIKRLQTKFDVVDYRETEHSGHLTEIIEECYADYDCVVVSGGDGTVNEAVSALAEKENAPAIGYIPSGTVNDVAHTLRIPKSVKRALDVIINGKPFEYDIMKINDKYAIYVCGFGLFTSSSYETKQSAKRRVGKIAYAFKATKEFFVAKSYDFEFEGDGQTLCGKTALALIVNSKYVAGMKFNKPADLQDGKADVIIFLEKKNRVSFGTKMRIFKMFLCGINRVRRSKHVAMFSVANAKVKCNAVVNCDGENGGVGGFNMKVINKGIKIYAKY